MTDRRLIEEWFPILELGIESLRERTPMTPFPAPNRLHVWWARRPLVASRAAILGALLPADADRGKFMHLLGIHGDPVEAKVRIEQATKDGIRLGKDAYGYPRAFSYTPPVWELDDIPNRYARIVCDPTAGGGSIPFESVRLGLQTVAADLNPVATIILRATVEFPAVLGKELSDRYHELGEHFCSKTKSRLLQLYPDEPVDSYTPDGYLWSRTITCPYCEGVIPLSPNWRLNSEGVGVRLLPDEASGAGRRMRFEIVRSAAEQSPGTVAGGTAVCPFPGCGRVVDGDEIKRQAQAGLMGDQLYAVVYKEDRIIGHTKTGKPKVRSVRDFRAPEAGDDVEELLRTALAEKLPEWEARGIVPDESILQGNKTTEPMRMGMLRWRDMFSPRQLYGHCTSVEAFQELVEECGGPEGMTELDRAALTYIALALDKMLNYNSRMSVWMPTREVVANTFNRHDFAFCWSYAEMAPTVAGLGYDWAIEQTGKALKELIELLGGPEDSDQVQLFVEESPAAAVRPEVSISCASADRLPHIPDGSVDAVVMDPPYYDNVMYAELSDFFYVWLKRTAGLLYPALFLDHLTDKDREAVANPARFRELSSVRGSGGAQRRAARDYRERMQAIFAECRRVLKPGGVMVLMFTHKATGAWDALATGLLEAGFAITASWPVNTEAEGSLHIKDKNAAKSTIFLVCRPRTAADGIATFWEDVEPKVTGTVRERVVEFQALGMRGVDLYLSCFGPALQVFSEHWPMKRGRALQKEEVPRGMTLPLLDDEEWDPYAVTPEDALMAARAAVKEWRLEQIATVKRHAHLDPVTEFFVLAWDAFSSPQFPADEALKLSRVVGTNFDAQLRGNILELKGGDVLLRDSAARAHAGALGRMDGECLLDAVHHAARIVRERNTGAARDALERAGLLNSDAFMKAMQSVLSVLPPPRSVGAGTGLLAGAAADAGAIERLRRLAFATTIPQPEQSELFE